MVFRNMQSKSGKVLATRRLIHAIKLDKTRKHPFFTTFHGHKTLPPTSRGLYASINYTYSATLDTVPDDLKSDTYPHAIFPHERDIPYPHRADTTACKPLTRNNDKLLPLHTYLAYALGLAAHLHFTGIRATHIRAIVDMAARHACTCIRCERMYETQLGIPAIWFAQLSSRAQRYAPRTRPRASRRAKARKEGVEKNVGRLPKLTDVAGTVLAPRRFLSAEISALATCTQRKAGFVVTDGLSLQYRDIQSSIRMLSLEAYVETYVALSTRKLGKPGTGEGDKGDGDTGDRVQGGREPEGNVCPDGYEEMQRIGCVNHIWESCCPVACRVAGGVLMAVQVEACCEASNYYVVSIGTAGDTVYVGSDGDADDRHSIAIRI